VFWFVPSVCVRSHVLLIWGGERRGGERGVRSQVRFVVDFVCDVLTV
jgi:hypothetical protein